MKRLPAEWEPQRAVMISMPHEDTDWSYMLYDILKCYLHIANTLSADDQEIWVVSPNTERARSLLDFMPQDRVRYFEVPTNDTWIRDYGVISCDELGGQAARLPDELGGQAARLPHELGGQAARLPHERIMHQLDFGFNGWGLKFAADKDNMVNSAIKEAFTAYKDELDYVLEGGSIESDGKGTILTTSRCLLSPNRNGTLTKKQVEKQLHDRLGTERVLWLDHGGLEGDDTDGHIDTLARFCPNDTIVYVSTDDTTRDCYEELRLMREELEQMRTAEGKPYHLVELPLPSPIRDENGEVLPATYANFLITNHMVIVPLYWQKEADELAMGIIQSLFPDREICGVDCRALIRQHGSLHCATMQISE